MRAYERTSSDPIYRKLRVFALDPAESPRVGNIACIRVPFEPVEPGPIGALIEVDGPEGETPSLLDLNDPYVMLNDGRDPSTSDQRFHQQMLYAVSMSVYQRFREALGRVVTWAYEREVGNGDPIRLRIRPFALTDELNAYYDHVAGELRFGSKAASVASRGRTAPLGMVHLALSHDIVVHEVTHALLDSLRPHFRIATHPDVPAFHEAFADIVAVFQTFSHRELVREALRRTRGQLDAASVLNALGRQLGDSLGGLAPIRSVFDDREHEEDPTPYDRIPTEPHARAATLSRAIYEAFITVYQVKTARYVQLATGGTGILPPGELPHGLLELLVEQASKLAENFLNMCIRAIDYCPPVDIRFGNYLRAVVTADRALVRDDPWGYRDAWIEAFRRRRIYPASVGELTEDALLLDGPANVIEIPELSFAALRFDGDPGRPASESELVRQAMEIGYLVVDPRHQKEFGLTAVGPREIGSFGVEVGRPTVRSVRTCRRIGPDGQVAFDLVAEVTQGARVTFAPGDEATVYCGSTIIIDPHGKVRLAIRKSLSGADGLEELRAFRAGALEPFWRPRSAGGAAFFGQLHGFRNTDTRRGAMPHDCSRGG
jgi:hypothetical protein